MQQLQIINQQSILNKQFKIYGSIEEPLFLSKDVAEWLEERDGYTVARKVDEDEKQLHTICVGKTSKQVTFLTENGLYEAIFQSKKPIAKEFKQEVKAILKQLRKTGVVATAAATPATISFETKFGIRRIRNSFVNSNDVQADYAEFKVLSKSECASKRIDNNDRINRCNIIIDVLESKLSTNMATMRGSEMLSLRETINEIKDDIIILANRKHGGIKSHQTMKLKALKQELELEKPSDDKYISLNIHGFSHNAMFVAANDYITGQPRFIKSNKYMEWINQFPVQELDAFKNLDFTKPIYFYAKYTMKENFDASNFIKTLLDRVASYFNVDDRLFIVKSQDIEGYCDDYKDGKIKLFLRN
jgi:prophage antirepressor-like protein